MRAAAALAMLVVSCGPAPLEPREPTPGVPHFTVATFNVHYPTAGDAETTAAVAAIGADLVFLQETDEAWASALAGERLDYPYRRFKVDRGPRGLSVLSRFPIEDSGLLPAPHDWHPAWRVVVQTPAGSAPGLARAPSLEVRRHGRSGDRLRANADRSPPRNRAVFRQLASTMPTLVLGDFNEEPGWQRGRMATEPRFSQRASALPPRTMDLARTFGSRVSSR